MFYMVGLGLADEKDITVRGLEIVKRASKVYLESYTSILLVDTPTLVRFLSPTCRNDQMADRNKGILLWEICYRG